MLENLFIRSLFRCGLPGMLLAGGFVGTHAQQPSVDAEELPSLPFHPPAEALATFDVVPGFEMDLVASEPLVYDPVAMSFDESGRLYVVEMRDYSERRPERLGRVRVLEDRDRDGVMDHSSVFVDNLPWPTAVLCYGGGVFVGSTPDILYCQDADGDRKADRVDVVLTGFASDYAPYETNRLNVQALMNSFRWGLDNRIHGVTSGAGGTVRSPQHPERAPVSLRGRDFSFDPRFFDIRPESGGAQHGMSFDDFGRKFVCSNSDHIQQVVYDYRYQGLNPQVPGLGPRVSIAEDGPAGPVFRLSPDEPWRVMRTRWRVAGRVGGPVEGGGRPSGYFTGATGVLIYRGDQWPEQHVGHAVVADCGSNLIHRKEVIDSGVVTRARRYPSDASREFVASRDNWFRPVQFVNAPDGTLWVADMCREVIEHPWSLPENIKTHLDLNRGFDAGRLYRIRSTERDLEVGRTLSGVSAESLVAFLGHRNAWHRETAARLLFERQDLATVPALEALVQGASEVLARVHALHVLNGYGALRPEILEGALRDAAPRVRIQALRLLEEQPGEMERLVSGVLKLVEDSDVRVRYQLALSLGRLRFPQRVLGLYALAKQVPADDRWLWHAVLNSAGTDPLAFWRRVVVDLDFWSQPERRERLLSICRFAGDPDEAAFVNGLRRLAEMDDPELAMAAIGQMVQGRNSAAGLPEARMALAALIDEARAWVSDSDLPVSRRLGALGFLGALRSPGLLPLVRAVIRTQDSSPLVRPGLRLCRRQVTPATLVELAEHLPRFLPEAKQVFLNLYLEKSGEPAILLDWLESGVIPGRLLSERQRDRFLGGLEGVLRDRAAALFRSGTKDWAAEARRLQPALLAEASLPRGRELFAERCATCHQVGQLGVVVGPAVTSMRSLRKRGILDAILDPNREVAPQYLSYTLSTTEREAVGLLVNESETTLTLRQAGGQDWSVPRGALQRLTGQNVSLMPEGLLEGLSIREVASLLEFVMYGKGNE